MVGFLFYLFLFSKRSLVGLCSKQVGYKKKWVLLAIDVPRDNEQSPKAVENIFSHLAGAAAGITFVEKYWDGEQSDPFSFEIVSIDGYVQYLVRCLEPLRDMVESALYAQYPDVEITRVEDYVVGAPHRFPDEYSNLFGFELTLAKHEVYPIRTYVDFEHGLTQELKDPMASLLENLSRLRIGEQVWIQILATPVSDDWKEKAQDEINKVLGKKSGSKESFLLKILFVPFNFYIWVVEALLGFAGVQGSESKEEDLFKMMNLTPGEKDQLTAMERKISKLGFEVKIRLIYIARKEVFSKVRGVASILGSLKQFNTLNLNAFRPIKKTVTKVLYFFKKSRVTVRQNKLIRAYMERSTTMGGAPFVLNIEELASIFHFPDLSVKAPLLKRTSAKKSEPPVGLPVFLGEDFMRQPKVKLEEESQESSSETGLLKDELGLEEGEIIVSSALKEPQKGKEKEREQEEEEVLEESGLDLDKEQRLNQAMRNYFSVNLSQKELISEEKGSEEDDLPQAQLEKELAVSRGAKEGYKKAKPPSNLPVG